MSPFSTAELTALYPCITLHKVHQYYIAFENILLQAVQIYTDLCASIIECSKRWIITAIHCCRISALWWIAEQLLPSAWLINAFKQCTCVYVTFRWKRPRSSVQQWLYWGNRAIAGGEKQPKIEDAWPFYAKRLADICGTTEPKEINRNSRNGITSREYWSVFRLGSACVYNATYWIIMRSSMDYIDSINGRIAHYYYKGFRVFCPSLAVQPFSKCVSSIMGWWTDRKNTAEQRGMTP